MPEANQRSVIIIGAGIAGLSTGIYAQMNGYQSQIFEMHTVPGGLMTAWKRKGYTVEGCIHWLTGSKAGTNFYPYWQDIGLIQNREIFDPEVFSQIEDPSGKVVTLYSDVDRLEKHLLALAPDDEITIKKMCNAVRSLTGFDQRPETRDGVFGKMAAYLNGLLRMARAMPVLMARGRKSIKDLGKQFEDPFLNKVFSEIWYPEMSAAAFLFTLAWLNGKSAGYPIGGSLPMAKDVEKRYYELGGKINYGQRVEKILVEDGRAFGIELGDGTKVKSDVVVSAADGFATIYKMLGGKYTDERIEKLYQDKVLFPSILYIGIGVNSTFEDLPKATSGMVTYLKEPITVAGIIQDRIEYRVHNFDPTLAPEGKTLITVTISANYDYWKKLAVDKAAYEAEKEEVGKQVLMGLAQRFPGIETQVEMIDVATPATFERYTGNWQASFEGWLPTPKLVMMQIPKQLPGLKNFYMVGQWVQPGGGLPSGVSTARDVVKQVCKEDGISFNSK